MEPAFLWSNSDMDLLSNVSYRRNSVVVEIYPKMSERPVYSMSITMKS